MKLTKEEKERLEAIYQEFLNDERIKRMKEVPMHFGSNCYLHSFKVAKKAIKHALRFRKVNLETVLVSAILHDYYLYDWRKDKTLKKHHGTRHPVIASEQALRDFGISPEIQKSIFILLLKILRNILRGSSFSRIFRFLLILLQKIFHSMNFRKAVPLQWVI